MGRYIQRETYLRQLMDRMGNGEVKIITGPRRSGKSWLLNRIFKDYLGQQQICVSQQMLAENQRHSVEEELDIRHTT